jgi:hypothetical protein
MRIALGSVAALLWLSSAVSAAEPATPEKTVGIADAAKSICPSDAVLSEATGVKWTWVGAPADSKAHVLCKYKSDSITATVNVSADKTLDLEIVGEPAVSALSISGSEPLVVQFNPKTQKVGLRASPQLSAASAKDWFKCHGKAFADCMGKDGKDCAACGEAVVTAVLSGSAVPAILKGKDCLKCAGSAVVCLFKAVFHHC